jgi:hypothetical protein
VVEALQVAMTGDPPGQTSAPMGCAEFMQHYAHALAVAPSAAVYGGLLSARSRPRIARHGDHPASSS